MKRPLTGTKPADQVVHLAGDVDVAMMLAAEGRLDGGTTLRVVLVTTHITFRDVPALLTADATELLLLQAGELGIPVLRKPVRPAALRALVSALVDRVSRNAQASSSGAGGAN